MTAAIWERRPHLAGSWEGGGNMVLVRRTAGLTVGESARRVLTRSPERRIVQFVGTSEGPALYNLHASTGKARSSRDVVRAAEFARETSGGLPYVLGGDFNCRPSRGSPFPELESRFGLASPPPGMAGSIDHLLVEGLEVLDEPRALDVQEREIRDPASGLLLRLSDHPPVVGTFGC